MFPVRNIQGEVVGQIELAPALFQVPVHQAVVHQALLRQLANARQGNASTLTRGEVAGSGRKLFAQKHTGWSRRGMLRNPLAKGSGTAFGPKPRSYRQGMPKKMRRLALKSVLSDKVREGEIIVVEQLSLAQPRAKEMKQILSNLGAPVSTLLVTAAAEPNVVKSARNLPEVKTLPAPLLNVADLLFHRFLVITADGVKRVHEIWGEKEKRGVVGNG